MKFICLMFSLCAIFISEAKAMPDIGRLYKLYCIEDDGSHHIYQLAMSGKHNGPDCLWDERVDGPMPDNVVVGAMMVQKDKKGKKTLIVDNSLIAKVNAELASKKERDDQAAADHIECMGLKKGIQENTADIDVKRAVQLILSGACE